MARSIRRVCRFSLVRSFIALMIFGASIVWTIVVVKFYRREMLNVPWLYEIEVFLPVPACVLFSMAVGTLLNKWGAVIGIAVGLFFGYLSLMLTTCLDW